MKMEAPGLIGLTFAAVVGSGYVVTGHRDFEVEIKRPMPEVYAAFSEIRMVGSGLRNEGFDVPKITVARPSDHELVFVTASENPERVTRIAFTFERGKDSVTTRVSAAIDVPPVVMRVDGQDKFLSEAKVEAKLQELIGEIGKQLNNRNSTVEAKYKLALMLDMVAVASHPKKLKAMTERVDRVNAEVDEVEARLESQGYEIDRGGTEPSEQL
jgi:hypothetical protein